MLIQAKVVLGGLSELRPIAPLFSQGPYTGSTAAINVTDNIDFTIEEGVLWTIRKDATGMSPTVFSTETPGLSLGVSGNARTATVQDPTFSSTGFSFPAAGSAAAWRINAAAYNYLRFLKALRFFDIVTYTGNGTGNRQIPHSLGVAPGMVWIKRTDAASVSPVWHKGTGANTYWTGFNASTLSATNGGEYFGSGSGNIIIPPTSADITVGTHATVNGSGSSYMAVLFADDPSGLIQCTSYTGNGGTTGPVVSLGWFPQLLVIKNTSNNNVWHLFCAENGMTQTSGGQGTAYGFSERVAGNSGLTIDFTATTFQPRSTDSLINANGVNYVVLAIRAP